MRYFCTYFDSNFLYQGLALYKSLKDQAGEFMLWVLCLDDTVCKLLDQLCLPEICTIPLKDFEASNPKLLSVKKERSLIEYYYTMTPLLPLYILNSHPDIDLIAYIDADLFFYSNVEPIYQEMRDGSIYIIPHRFNGNNGTYSEDPIRDYPAGRYNVGYVLFRRDVIGLACLKRWTQQCLDCCLSGNKEPGKWGDQKYLDDWPKEFSGVVESQHHGIGAGGWNHLHYQISRKNGLIYLDEYPLIMLHLNFIELLNSSSFTGTARWYLRHIYRPYGQALRISIDMVKNIAPAFAPAYGRIPYWLWLARLIRGGVVFI